jgi:hypothetical protein
VLLDNGLQRIGSVGAGRERARRADGYFAGRLILTCPARGAAGFRLQESAGQRRYRHRHFHPAALAKPEWGWRTAAHSTAGLPSSVVIDARPGGHGPTVVQLPEERTYDARPVPAHVFGALFHALRLQDLACVQKGGEVFRLWIVAEKVSMNDVIPLLVLLVVQHHRCEDAGAILRSGKRLDRSQFRKRLKAVLGRKSVKVLVVVPEWLTPVPDAPVVSISRLKTVGGLFIIGAWRAWPVGNFGVFPLNDRRENSAEYREVGFPYLPPSFRRLTAEEGIEHRFVFIVSGPERNTGVVSKPPYLLLYFRLRILLPVIGTWIPATRKHQIVPHH